MRYFIQWPNTDTVYTEGHQPQGAVEIPQGVDPTVCDLVDGRLVVNPVKVAAKEVAEQAQAQAAQAAVIAKAARRLRLTGDMANVNSVAELKAIIKDIVAELGI
jgi:hypothetical protein